MPLISKDEMEEYNNLSGWYVILVKIRTRQIPRHNDFSGTNMSTAVPTREP